MTEEHTLARFESSGGARIVRLPVEAFPGFWAYVYIVQQAEYCVLVDTGSGTDISHANLLDGLDQSGVSPTDFTHILLTHAHIDHYGGLSRLQPLANARVGVHELDLQSVAHHESRLARIGVRLAAFLAETGLAEETRDQILGIYRFTKGIYQSTPVHFTLEQQFGPFDIIHLPGHCPGHVALRVDDVVLCGDMVVQGVTPHLSPESIHPYSGLDHYLESLRRLEQWAKDARLILNGHDDAITDLSAQIELTKHNILRRVSKAIEALHEPLTIEQICTAVYGGTAGYNLLLVIEKTGAYVEYLYEHGMIEIVNPSEVEQGQPAKYQRSMDEQVVLQGFARQLGIYTTTQVHT